MPTIKQPVEPGAAYVWSRSGARDIRAIKVDYGDSPSASLFIQGVSRVRGIVLNTSGFMVQVQEFEPLCRAFLAQLDKERGTPDQLLVAAEDALAHVEELEEAWSRGALSEHDGKGGTRSNRNVDCRVRLRAAIAHAKGKA